MKKDNFTETMTCLHIEYASGDKFWWQNGQRHRDNDLPAVEGTDGTKEYWINGVLKSNSNI